MSPSKLVRSVPTVALVLISGLPTGQAQSRAPEVVRESAVERGVEDTGKSVFVEDRYAPAGLPLGLRSSKRSVQTSRAGGRTAARRELGAALAGAEQASAVVEPRAATRLVPGAATPFSFPSVDSATLFRGDYSFVVTVPAGASQLEVKIETTTPNADVDLFVRYGQDPVVEGGRVTADYRSEGPTGTEVIRIASASSPQLREGDYYISMAVYTTGVSINGRVTASLSGGPVVGDPSVLSNGSTARFAFPAVSQPTLYYGEYSFRMNVPDNATRVIVRLDTTTPGADLDLYVRRGADISLGDGHPVTDYASEGPTGSERVEFTAQSNPPLRPGLHYIAFGLFTPNVNVEGTVSVTIETAPVLPGQVLAPGQAVTFTLPAVDRTTLFNGENSYRITVPDTSRPLRVQISSDTPGADVDLYVRAGADVGLVDGRVVADFRSEGPTADETVTVSAGGNPALRAGVYYIAFGVFTTGKAVNVRVVADFVTTTPPPQPPNTHDLRSGVPATWNFPAVNVPTLLYGDYGYTINVPQGARRLEVRLSTATPGTDIDLFVRFGQDIALSSGRVLADFSSEGPTGEETIVITPTSSPALRAGVYYIGFATFTTGRAATGTVVATVQ